MGQMGNYEGDLNGKYRYNRELVSKPSTNDKDSTETFVGRGASSWESWELSKSRVYENIQNSHYIETPLHSY